MKRAALKSLQNYCCNTVRHLPVIATRSVVVVGEGDAVAGVCSWAASSLFSSSSSPLLSAVMQSQRHMLGLYTIYNSKTSQAIHSIYFGHTKLTLTVTEGRVHIRCITNIELRSLNSQLYLYFFIRFARLCRRYILRSSRLIDCGACNVCS